MKNKFGLIGKKLSHSFSKQYFEKKFKDLNLKEYTYDLWELEDLKDVRNFIENIGNVRGFNVTIPYKEKILEHLDVITDEVKSIGACNCVLIKDNQWIGYNTDWWAFLKMIENKLDKHHQSAIILGTGGASKAVAYAFEQLSIPYMFVSRNFKNEKNILTYQELKKEHFEKHYIIVNTTPVGMYPDISVMPNIPIYFIYEKNFVIDIIYNPEKTMLLQEAEKRGSKILNGLEMLYLQAEKSWYIWQNINDENYA